MTLDEFLNKLSRLRHKGSKKKVKWYLLPDGRIRTVVKNKSKGYYCPLTAVYKAETGMALDVVDVGWAQANFNLGEYYIVIAADATYNSKIVATLRAKLLKACGLTKGA